MGAKKLKTKLHLADFDRDRDARHNLLDIIKSDARNLYPREAAWFLGVSVQQVYEEAPRVKTFGSEVRFDPSVIKRLKHGLSPNIGSLKTEKKKNADPKRATRTSKKMRVRLWD